MNPVRPIGGPIFFQRRQGGDRAIRRCFAVLLRVVAYGHGSHRGVLSGRALMRLWSADAQADQT